MRRLGSVFLFLALSTLSIKSRALSISSIKGSRVVVNLESTFVSVGDQYFLINPTTGKKTAILQIQQIKGDKALAQILKGQAAPGYTFQVKSSAVIDPQASALMTPTPAEPPTPMPATTGLRPQYGVLAGIFQNQMSAKITYSVGNGSSTSDVSMTGMGLSIGGFYDYLLKPDLFLQGLVAYEQFNVTGTSIATACENSSNCFANITYLSTYAILKWYVGSSFRSPFWIGGGGGFLFAMSKSASALNVSEVNTNQTLVLATGMDFPLESGAFIPVSLGYHYFPDSPTVTASSLYIRVGYSF